MTELAHPTMYLVEPVEGSEPDRNMSEIAQAYCQMTTKQRGKLNRILISTDGMRYPGKKMVWGAKRVVGYDETPSWIIELNQYTLFNSRWWLRVFKWHIGSRGGLKFVRKDNLSVLVGSVDCVNVKGHDND